MAKTTVAELASRLEQLQAQIAEMAHHIETLEKAKSGGHVTNGRGAVAVMPAPAAAEPGISEEELLAVAAAIGAFLGVRAHIRQIRLVSSTAWAVEGRVSIQASHRLQG